jgi:predicted transcriptional regulator
MTIGTQKQFLTMMKALADESRLTLVQLVNGRELTVGELAERVALTEPTVSHHLSKLREAGLVTLRMAGTQRFYRVNQSGLGKFKTLAAHIEELTTEEEPIESDNEWIAALGWAAEDQQILRDYTLNGRLTRIPSKQKKLMVILRWLATLFQAEILYTEPQVNTILKSVHEPDHATLRRELVDFGYLRRERGGGKYWLAPADENIPTN